jgi:hypothetical protein
MILTYSTTFTHLRNIEVFKLLIINLLVIKFINKIIQINVNIGS